MDSSKRNKDAHLWNRDPHDWYVEPYECSNALFLAHSFTGPIWDPACGMGRIVETAVENGHSAFGSDIVRRSNECNFVEDFLDADVTRKFGSIVCNPPFGQAEKFVQKGLAILGSGGQMAMLLPLVWLAGFSQKRSWLPTSPLESVYVLSPRPSMPPGAVIEAGIKPGNGTKDFAWLVWCHGNTAAPEIRFLNTRKLLLNGKNLSIENKTMRNNKWDAQKTAA